MPSIRDYLRKPSFPKIHVERHSDRTTRETTLSLSVDGSPQLTLAAVVVWCADADDQIPLEAVFTSMRRQKSSLILEGTAAHGKGRNARAYSLKFILHDQQKSEPWVNADMIVRNESRRAWDTAVEPLFAFPCAEPPRWMIPGMFYKDNGYGKAHRVYPRFHPTMYEPDQFVSPGWSFRADRCATPAVFAQSGGFCFFLSTDEQFSHGVSSVGFSFEAVNADATHTCRDEDCSHDLSGAVLSLSFPWRELPVQYAPHNPKHLDGEIGYVELSPGEAMACSFRIGITAESEQEALRNYAFAPVLRRLYQLTRPDNELRPWMPTAQAAELAAFGSYEWFYQAEDRVLVETCGFDKYFAMARNLPGYVDRPHMHVSWVSGIAYAHAMARWGEENGHGEYLHAGNSVIEKICAEGLAPCGAFWAQWVKEKNGWDAGWNPNPEWLHARTLGEACYFLSGAIQWEEQQGRRHAGWRKALRSCLDFALGAMNADGNPGTYYHCRKGTVEEWNGTAGMAWIPAWIRAAALDQRKNGSTARSQSHRYLKAAVKAGDYYRRFLDDACLYGGCEDVSLSPCSEDGYIALMAYASLYEATGEKQRLDDACRAAEWMLTFRWMYNTEFPEYAFLQQYDFRTTGGDVASPPNQHLHNYGLIAFESLVKLWMWTGDDHYYDRARDNLHYSLQMIARADGDMNARRGMMSEQWYHTDWWQPKGCMLQLAHVWCAGFLIIAEQVLRRLKETAPPRFRKRVDELDPKEWAK